MPCKKSQNNTSSIQHNSPCSLNPIHTNKGGLPEHTNKQLLQHIEDSAGGIQDFTFKKLSQDQLDDLGADDTT